MDSTFKHQDIHIIEADGTIDTYKRILIQDNAFVYSLLFGENPNLPNLVQLDREFLKDIKKRLLWSFRTGKLEVG